jgi:putative oxidoreductase
MTSLAQTKTSSKAVRITAIVSRILLGLLFVVFGLNGFLNFIPQGAPPEGAAGAFLGGLAQTGYFFPFLKGLEVIIGLMLLSNRFVPLALVLLMPINLNIFLFHLFLGPETMLMSVVLMTLNIFLAWVYRDNYRSLLTNKNAI